MRRNPALSVLFGVVLFLVMLLQSGAHVQAQSADYETLDAYITGQMRALKIPGLALAIVRGNQIEYVRGYGVADDTGRPVTPQTPFLIASMSKSFTALGVMQLVEEGKIDLDAPVQKYLPWFQVADTQAASQITVRHLLYQTSGFSELQGYQRNLESSNAEDALETSIRKLKDSRLNATPGVEYEYSNTNYDILGLLIQSVSGKPYEVYVRDRIFNPLGMENSFTSLAEARSGGASSGYIPFLGATVEYDQFMPYARAVVPSAGLFASADDMAAYLYAHLNQGVSLNGQVILSPAGVEQLHAPGTRIGEQVGYAMGWAVFPFPDVAVDTDSAPPTAVSHGGDWANFKSLMVLIPERKLGVVVLMNKSDSARGSAYNNIGWNTALVALGLEAKEFPQHEGFLGRYGRGLMMGIVLVWIAGLVWSVRQLTKRSPWGRSQRSTHVGMVVHFVLDLTLAGYLWFETLLGNNSTLPLALRFEPDLGFLYLVALLLSLGWGTLRTGLWVKKIMDEKNTAVEVIATQQ